MGEAHYRDVVQCEMILTLPAPHRCDSPAVSANAADPVVSVAVVRTLAEVEEVVMGVPGPGPDG